MLSLSSRNPQHPNSIRFLLNSYYAKLTAYPTASLQQNTHHLKEMDHHVTAHTNSFVTALILTGSMCLHDCTSIQYSKKPHLLKVGRQQVQLQRWECNRYTSSWNQLPSCCFFSCYIISALQSKFAIFDCWRNCWTVSHYMLTFTTHQCLSAILDKVPGKERVFPRLCKSDISWVSTLCAGGWDPLSLSPHTHSDMLHHDKLPPFLLLCNRLQSWIFLSVNCLRNFQVYWYLLIYP